MLTTNWGSYWIGYVDGAPSDPNQALAFYTQALQANPQCAELYYDLAELIQRTSGNYYHEQALVLYQKALELCPNWAQIYPEWRRALKLLGEVLTYPLGRPDDGQQAFNAYVNAETEIAAAHPLGAAMRIMSNWNSPQAIGHMCIENDMFVKMGQLGWRPPFEGVLLVPNRAANKAALDYWRPHLTVVDNPIQMRDLEPLRKWLHYDTWYVRVPDGRVLPAHHAYAMVQREWERQGRGPVLTLSDHDHERGWKALESLGVPRNAWFVCAHARDLGYYKESEVGPTAAFRNGSINSYIPAMKRIVEHGGWVIRVGDPSMPNLEPLPNVIDYVHSPVHSDWMDVFLAAQCRFFLGCESGLMNLPGVFGVPCAIVGWTVVYSLPWFENDIFITRIPYLRPEERTLSWSEMSKPPFASGQRDRWLAAGLEMHENSPEEIVDLVEEMLEKLDGRCNYSPEDVELQALARKTIDSPISNGTGARVGRAFMRRHGRKLFEA